MSAADRDTRTEAVARYAVCWHPAEFDELSERRRRSVLATAGTYLAAADADDRENGIVRIKLDDELAEKIATTISGAPFASPRSRSKAQSVLSVLREAVAR